MNWKNRTYFQTGRDVRGFEASADRNRVAGGQRPRRRRPVRRFLGWVVLLVVVFGAGLSVGLVEDFEAEEWAEDVGASLFGVSAADNSAPNVQWRHVLKGYERKETKHFKCRMDCRNVTHEDLESAFANAELVDYIPRTNSCTNGFEAKYSIVGLTSSRRSLTIIFSANNATRVMNLITVWENGKEFDCSEDC